MTITPQGRRPQSGVDRRSFFQQVSGGICGAALMSLLGDDVYGGERHESEADAGQPRRIYNLQPRQPHFQPRAKAVIHLFMNGGPSQMDLFDPKPELDKRHGQPYFDEIAGEVENPVEAGAVMRSPFKFSQHGACGMWASELMPHLAECVEGGSGGSDGNVDLCYSSCVQRLHREYLFPQQPQQMRRRVVTHVSNVEFHL